MLMMCGRKHQRSKKVKMIGFTQNSKVFNLTYYSRNQNLKKKIRDKKVEYN